MSLPSLSLPNQPYCLSSPINCMSAVKEWAFVTSWHGVADVYRAKSYLAKTLWMIVLLITTMMFCSQVYSHFKNFDSAEHDPWTESTVIVQATSLPLPMVTLCSMNLVSRDSLNQLNMSVEAASYVVQLYRSLYNTYGNDRLQHATSVKDMYSNHSAAFDAYLVSHPESQSLSLYDWLIRLGPDCQKIFQVQIFLSFEPMQNPCANAKVFYTMRGLCYSFEPRLPNGDWSHQTASGHEDAMELWVKIAAEDYAPISDERVPDLGVSVFLGFDAVESAYRRRLTVSPGVHTWVLMASEASKAPQKPLVPFFNFALPPWPCLKSAKLKVVDSEGYSNLLCYRDCGEKIMSEICGCFHRASFPIRKHSNLTQCNMTETVLCRDKVTTNLSTILSSCKEECQQSACNHRYITYDVTSVQSPADPDSTAANMRNYFNLSLDNVNMKQMAVLNIYYMRLASKMYQYQLRTSVEQLISNVGGQLGLWAGISIITLYQALMYAGYTIWNVICKRFTRDSIEDNSKIHPEQNKLGLKGIMFERSLKSPVVRSNSSPNVSNRDSGIKI